MINTKEKDGLQFSQSLREKGSASLFKSSNNSKKDKENSKNDDNQSKNIAKFNDSAENIDPFRQTCRKKEERAKLPGFACDQCEKVRYSIFFNFIEFY